MDDYYLYKAIIKLFVTRQDDIKSAILDGNVGDWAQYQNLVGQLTSLRKLEAEVRELFRKREISDDTTEDDGKTRRKER